MKQNRNCIFWPQYKQWQCHKDNVKPMQYLHKIARLSYAWLLLDCLILDHSITPPWTGDGVVDPKSLKGEQSLYS